MTVPQPTKGSDPATDRRTAPEGLWRRLNASLEAAFLRELLPGQQQALALLVLACAISGLALAVWMPETSSLTLMLPILAGCFLSGVRRLWLLPPLVALQYHLQNSPAAAAVFLVGGASAVLIVVLLADRFRMVRAHGAELKRSMEVARHVQRALEPRPLVEWDILEMATMIRYSETLGGDFVCHQPVGPDRFGIVLGDVSGKGVRAALAAAFVTGLYGELAREGFGPSAILEIISRRLHEMFRDFDLFVTIVALEFDPRRNEWRAAVAGHDPPFLMRSDGQVEEMLERGTAAGILPDEHYQDMRRPARAGDQIFLASDGLIPDGLPESEVRQILLQNATRPLPKTLEAVASELQGRLPPNYHDDTTGVLIRLVD